MGSQCSKGPRKPSVIRRPIAPNISSSDEEIYGQDMFDRKAINQLRHDFEEDFEMFLLNNVLMSVMFFENFDEEIMKAKTLVAKDEHELNERLMREHSKQCVMPDTMFLKVNQRVRFVRKHGPKKGVIEPLIPMRMFVVHDTVEIVNESEDLDHYTVIGKPTHRVNVEQSDHPGYVKLKLGGPLNGLERHSSNNSLNSSESSTYANGQALLTNQPTASCSSDESEYEYARINQARTERPLNINNQRSNSGGLPPGCIIEVKQKNLEVPIVRYVNSEKFMKNFRETDFPVNLARSLGFSADEVKTATHTSGSIFCNTYDIGQETEGRNEVIPAVNNPFPDLNSWGNRKRNKVRVENIIYVFPTQKMINDILAQPSVVIPRGFLQKRGTNPEYKYEWEAAYPKAERNIQARMFHAHIRCYLFLVIFFKSFIEPITQQKGLVIDHLRNLIFWECEKNYINWPEHRLGHKLKLVLARLQEHLGKRTMPDYFHQHRNVFCNIPDGHLFKAQEQIHRIMENPVTYAISALRNVHYSSDSFYPRLNFDALYKLLTDRAEAERLVAPGAVKASMQPTVRNEIRLTKEQEWERAQIMKTKEERIRKQQQELKNLNQKRASIDSINLKFNPNAIMDRDNLMVQKSFLVFFIRHFLEIVEFSKEYKAWNQYQVYLDQAKYLTVILENADPTGAKEILEDIRRRRHLNQDLEASTPTTPARNSTQNFTGYLVKGQTLDISNLTKSHQRGVQQKSTPMSSINLNGNGLSFIEVNRIEEQNQVVKNQSSAPRRNTKVNFSNVEIVS